MSKRMRYSGEAAPASKFFLFLGDADVESAVSKLQTSNIWYEKKRLNSGPDNWRSIQALVTNTNLIAVAGKVATNIFIRLASEQFAQIGPDLLRSLSTVSHVLFVHEDVLSGIPDLGTAPQYKDGEDPILARRFWQDSNPGYMNPTLEIRSRVMELFDEFNINIVPYRKNAELALMVGAFVDDHERDLLFRVYIPAGRLYAAEADKLIALFRKWLAQVGQQEVRQDGYETPSGHMYEFFGDGTDRSISLRQSFNDFSDFLELCLEDPATAEAHLASLGFDSASGAGLVTQYAKEGRRLQLDLKQERDKRVMAIQHRLESDLLEHSIARGDVSTEAVRRLVSDLIPSHLVDILGPGTSPASGSAISVQVNNQVVNCVEATVLQNIQGTSNFSDEAKTLLELIQQHGGSHQAELESAVYELEDPSARGADRLGARQRLKGFLIKVGSGMQDVAVSALVKYVDTKLGL